MKLRNLVVLVLALLVVGFSLIAYLAQTDRFRPTPVATASAAPSSSNPGAKDASTTGAVADRRKHDELRKKILEAWMKTPNPEIAQEAKEGRFVPHPNADGTSIDPKYIQAVMREDMFPMVRACYEDLLTRQPDAGGQVDLWFKIVADDKLGGIVEEDDEHDAGTVSGWSGDEKMSTCMRESLLTLSFPPPAHGGVVTVGYPIGLAPGDDDANK